MLSMLICGPRGSLLVRLSTISTRLANQSLASRRSQLAARFRLCPTLILAVFAGRSGAIALFKRALRQTKGRPSREGLYG